MSSVLIFGDTVRLPELRREIPHAVADPFLYVEHDEKRYVVVRSLEVARMNGVAGLNPLPLEEFGLDELVAGGSSSEDALVEIASRACSKLGVTRATVPGSFPIEIADRLRADGLQLDVKREVFFARRRSKTSEQLGGMRKATRAAEAATAAIAACLRASEPVDGVVHFEGRPLTSERLKTAAAQAFVESDAVADEFIVAHGWQTCTGHHMGSGEIGVAEPITVDLWPRDASSGYHTDMTRTFVVGEVSDELRAYHGLCQEALARAVDAIRPGVRGRDLHRLACEVFEAAGYPTQLSKQPGEVLLDGFFHGLGHGVGLEVHESPQLDLSGGELIPGDVVAVEPGCYRQGYGGVRLEDLVLVTDDGCEVITQYPYDLEP